MSHKVSGAAELGSSGWTAVSSAGEWAIKTSDGGLAIVTDQANGVGVLKLGTTVWGSNAPTSTAQSGSGFSASSSSSDDNTGAIVGGVVGVVVLVGLGAAVYIFFFGGSSKIAGGGAAASGIAL